MVYFKLNGIQFILRVGGIALRDGRVLLNRSSEKPWWFVPGGRVEEGEDSRTALAREMREEIGEEAVIGDFLATIENFFEQAGCPQHEVGLYYAMTVRRADEGFVIIDGGSRVEYRWIPLAEVAGLELYPAVVKRYLLGGDFAAHHLVRE